jgi:5-methylcytosine-specific restriction endonuclease McrA
MNNCINCNKETNNPKFCSSSCAAIVTNKLYPKRKTKKTCTKCGKPVKSYRHTLCEKHHKEYTETRYDYFQTLPLKEYWNRKCLTNLHTSSKNAHIRGLARSKYKDLIKLPCANCGYDKHVELCHIKPLSSFSEDQTVGEANARNNIIQLCRNCHWEFDHGLLFLDFPEQPEFT